MSDHSHHQCQHVLAFCARCDAPYCTACKREWNSTLWVRPYPSFPQPTYPYWTTTTTSPNTMMGSTTVASASSAGHAHD